MHTLGVDPHSTLGIDHDGDACDTHRLAGFPTLRADVSQLDPREVAAGADGLIASPPCQAFSLAGKGLGREAIARMLAHVDACADGYVPPDGMLCADDVRADLTLEPLRWADTLRPRWVACEQVPAVLPLWEAIGRVLSGWGYSVWTGLLDAERYGVPQTRKRAFLIARRDGPAEPPVPTHTGYDWRQDDGGKTPVPSLLGDDLAPWVSMADALGWHATYRAGTMDNAASRDGDEPAPTIAFGHNAAQHQWVYRNGTRERAAERELDEPAPTVMFGESGNEVSWVVQTGANTMRHQRDQADGKYERPIDCPAPTVDSKVGGAWRLRSAGKTGLADRGPDEPATTLTGKGNAVWTHERPATTVVGSFRPDVIAAPGWRGPGDGPRQDADGSVRVTVAQAACLQSFPPWWPWSGSKTSRYRQVGNAVPPLLAAAVLAPVLMGVDA